MADGWGGVQRNYGDRIGGMDWFVQCPKPNCYFSIGVRSQGEGEKRLREHTCPQGGALQIGWYNVGVTLVRQLWAEMDRALDEYKVPNPTDTEISRAIEQGYLRGLSFAIQLFMHPYYPDTDAVAKEAGRRKKARDKGEERESPGLGLMVYQPPPGAVDHATAAEATPAKKAARKRTTANAVKREAPKAVELTEEMKGDLIFGLECGMSPKQLATQYGVTEAQVESLRPS